MVEYLFEVTETEACHLYYRIGGICFETLEDFLLISGPDMTKETVSPVLDLFETWTLKNIDLLLLAVEKGVLRFEHDFC